MCSSPMRIYPNVNPIFSVAYQEVCVRQLLNRANWDGKKTHQKVWEMFFSSLPLILCWHQCFFHFSPRGNNTSSFILPMLWKERPLNSVDPNLSPTCLDIALPRSILLLLLVVNHHWRGSEGSSGLCYHQWMTLRLCDFMWGCHMGSKVYV